MVPSSSPAIPTSSTGPRRSTPRRGVVGVLLAALLCALTVSTGTTSATAVSRESNPPPGANDWSCQPSAAHPRPVVLIHGLSANARQNWSYLSPLLAERGYCVYALTYGMDPRLPASRAPGGTIDMRVSARELDAFVAKVRASTGADEVDFVGHSEGTFMPLYWLKHMGGASQVHSYVAYTPLYDGTKFLRVEALRDAGAQFGLSTLAVNLFNRMLCTACTQVLSGSGYHQKVAEGGDGVPGVRFTTVMTRYDELVVPYTSGHLDTAVDNFVLQDVCPDNLAEHALVAFDPVAAQITFNALDPAHAQPIECLPVFSPPPAPAA